MAGTEQMLNQGLRLLVVGLVAQERELVAKAKGYRRLPVTAE